ncbi:ribosomal protein S18-alanine N-acetyltransferase [Microbulbifer agarilyticus]|uniref:ribosomal protein S18-alanine N-acetyltransferase n=1 Tax=Microbulbifer agarilyticus TaxID=260552 RepID=UPI0018DBA86B|nr:ribosomal protein S18-alanine N-acetyltransferase [Microbulbifer agarilyticus]
MNSSSFSPSSGFSVADLTFVRAEEGDCDALAILARGAHSHPWSAQQYRDSLSSGHRCWVLRVPEVVDEPLSGLVACCVTSRLFDEIEVFDVAVAPEWQNRGVGTQLLQRVLAQCPDDVARVLLEVRASNRSARALYHKLGFSEDGRRKNYYPKSDGTREDALLMSLIL